MMVTTRISVNDWFFNKYSNEELREILYDFADELNVSTAVSASDGRCTIARELARMEGIERGRANWRETAQQLA